MSRRHRLAGNFCGQEGCSAEDKNAHGDAHDHLHAGRDLGIRADRNEDLLVADGDEGRCPGGSDCRDAAEELVDRALVAAHGA